MLRGASEELLVVGLRSILYKKFKSYKEAHSVVYNMDTSKKSKEEDLTFSGLGAMPPKPEGQPIEFDDPFQGYKTEYINITYGLGFRVSEEAVADDQYKILAKMPDQLARSAFHTKELQAVQTFNNAFAAGSPGADSVSLINTAHPLLGGGTGSNALPVAADLDVTSLTALLNIIDRTTDDRGLLQNIKAKLLIVPQELRFTASELLKSERKPFVETNEINSLLDEELKFFSYPWLTDVDAWFLQAEKSEHSLNFLNRMALKDEADHDFRTGDLLFKATQRFSFGWSDWRGIAGSPGA